MLTLLLISFFVCQKNESKFLAKVNKEIIKVEDFFAALPKSDETKALETSEQTFSRYQEILSKLIDQRLLIQEARRRDLASKIEAELELRTKTMLVQKLLREEILDKAVASPEEIKTIYGILPTEVHLGLISVASPEKADTVYKQLQSGKPFESCANQFSRHPSSKSQGDIGFVKLAYLPEPVRKAVGQLKPGSFTPPINTEKDIEILKLIEKRTVPVKSFAEEELSIRKFLEQQRAKNLHRELFDKLNSRLVYNPKTLQVFFKRADQITDDEKELWVVKKDETLMVRVGSLLHVAQRFNPAIDTALRIYAIKREIEDDLLYEEAKNKYLNQDPALQAQVNKIGDELLYQIFYEEVVTKNIAVSDSEVVAYYNSQKGNYPGGSIEPVRNLIRNRILTERKNQAEANFAQQLRSQAKIEINENLLRSISVKQKRS